LIVSTVVLDVVETLKGPAAPTLNVSVEGGTVGDLTLTVSDLPSLQDWRFRDVLFGCRPERHSGSTPTKSWRPEGLSGGPHRRRTDTLDDVRVR